MPTVEHTIIMYALQNAQHCSSTCSAYSVRRILTHLCPCIRRPPTEFLKIRFNITFPSTLSPSKWPLSLTFPHQNLAGTSPRPHSTTCHANHASVDLITRRVLGAEYQQWISSRRSIPHCPVTESLLGKNIFLSSLFSNTLSLLFS
jgi:hypothetical protein